MIRHCVFIRFKPEMPKETKAELYAEIVALKLRLPGFLAAHIGGNVSPESGMDKGHSEGFVIDFDGPAARDVYLADPDHQGTGARIVANAIGGLDGILVYDIEIADPNS